MTGFEQERFGNPLFGKKLTFFVAGGKGAGEFGGHFGVLGTEEAKSVGRVCETPGGVEAGSQNKIKVIGGERGGTEAG